MLQNYRNGVAASPYKRYDFWKCKENKRPKPYFSLSTLCILRHGYGTTVLCCGLSPGKEVCVECVCVSVFVEWDKVGQVEVVLTMLQLFPASN